MKVGLDLPTGLEANLVQGLDEALMVLVMLEDGFA
jgi:hypothetical protein